MIKIFSKKKKKRREIRNKDREIYSIVIRRVGGDLGRVQKTWWRGSKCFVKSQGRFATWILIGIAPCPEIKPRRIISSTSIHRWRVLLRIETRINRRATCSFPSPLLFWSWQSAQTFRQLSATGATVRSFVKSDRKLHHFTGPLIRP